MALFTLFMWDVIFIDGIANVFYNKNQPFPLDLYSDCFYENRVRVITERLKKINDMTEQVSRLFEIKVTVYLIKCKALVVFLFVCFIKVIFMSHFYWKKGDITTAVFSLLSLFLVFFQIFIVGLALE